MIEKLCLPVKCNYEEKYVCNEAYIDSITKCSNNNIKFGVSYEVVNNKLVQCMEDLIRYCLTYNIDIEIPDRYKVITIYNIIFATGNFEPNGREYSRCSSSIVYSSLDLKYIEDKFNFMCKTVGKKNNSNGYKHYFCWHTEDFAHNQIIHSYNIDESYIIERVVE